MEYKPQNVICQNCKTQFTIEPEDFNFYEKIKVPSPTFCPECRMIRRMSWRNARNLYKHICDAKGHGEIILSIYSKEKKHIVYDQKYWWRDSWDPLDYGKNYDFSKPFFIQFDELIKNVPLPNVSNLNPVNTEYANMTIDSKNCYLVFSGSRNENCFYSEGINDCRNCFDLLSSNNNEHMYDSIDSRNCF